MMLIVTSYESDINLIIVFVKKFESLLPSITFKKKKKKPSILQNLGPFL